MTVKRIVSEKQAEIATYKSAQLLADILPNGQEKVTEQAKADDFRGRVNNRRAGNPHA